MTSIIREDLLYYLWKTKIFNMNNLVTEDGQTIEILDFGLQNHDAGPDFFNAKIKIDNTIWVGNVEMHVFSSDWKRHNHDLDKAYDNVILHVVYEHDREIHTTTDQFIPCLELKGRIPAVIKSNYAKLISNNNWIPCEKTIHKVDDHIVSFWLQRLVAERLEAKTAYIKTILESTNNDWEETLYIVLTRYLGSRVNLEPFESLAKSLSLTILQKNKDDILKIEALFFGQAGMLAADHKDEYFQQLKTEYYYLSKKYDLHPIPIVGWKFAKMRPIGFPTIRIAQLAQIIFNTEHLFSKIKSTKDINKLKEYFSVMSSEYWNDHYRFGNISVYKEKPMGAGLIDLIVINVISPILFLYGKSIDDPMYCDRAIDHLEAIKYEKNKIIKKYKSLGIQISSASDSQALIQLKNEYCKNKKCMSCNIGNKLILG